MITAIWAQDVNGLIGSNGKLPWHLPADLAFFKEMTMGSTMIMGRKTFEGMGSRPLPGRQTIVITRDKDYKADGVIVANAVTDALSTANALGNEIFIVGGAAVYREFMPFTYRIMATKVHGEFLGDTYMDPINKDEFVLTAIHHKHPDELNKNSMTWETYERIIGGMKDDTN